MFPDIRAGEVPRVTKEEMIEVDRAMIEDYRIDLPRMMENAGRSLASLTRSRFLEGDAAGRKVLVLAGSGGNGGGALVAARHLSNWGADITVALAQPVEAMTPVPAHQLGILREMAIPVDVAENADAMSPAFERPEVIIDGIIGYSLNGRPTGPAAALIERANQSAAKVVALDTPSGVDAGEGDVFEPAIVADATLTLALPKSGLFETAAIEKIGELYCTDISVPPGLYRRYLSKDVPTIFSRSEIVRIVAD